MIHSAVLAIAFILLTASIVFCILVHKELRTAYSRRSLIDQKVAIGFQIILDILIVIELVIRHIRIV